MILRNFLVFFASFALAFGLNPFFPIYWEKRENELDLECRDLTGEDEGTFDPIQHCSDHSFVLVGKECTNVCCANRSDFPDDNGFPLTLRSPTTMKKCPGIVDYYADSDYDTVMEGDIKGENEYQWLIDDYQFLACLSAEFMETLEPKPEPTDTTTTPPETNWPKAKEPSSSSLVSVHAENSVSAQITDLPNLSFLRTWDLRGDCQRRWYPHSGLDTSSGVASPNSGRSIHCRKRDCDRIKLTFESDENFDFKIDQIVRAKSFCLQSDYAVVEPDYLQVLGEEFADSYECVEQCRSLARVMALVNSEKCVCVRDFGALRRSLPHNPCTRPCSDNDEELCGLEGEPGYFSAYSLLSTSFKYVMTLNKDNLRHPLETVVPSSFIRVQNTNQALECLAFCKEFDFDVAIFGGNEGEECTCLLSKFYRFQMSDLAFTPTVTHFCPFLNAPCATDSDMDGGYGERTVFCEDKDNNCGKLIDFGFDHQACTENHKLAHNENEQSYFLCTKDSGENRNKWIQEFCEDDMYFDEEMGECRELSPETTSTESDTTTPPPTTTPRPRNCCDEDDQHIWWNCRANQSCHKGCDNPRNSTCHVEGEYDDDDDAEERLAFWHCDGKTGTFSSSQPDRSQCIKPKNCSDTDSEGIQWDCLANKKCTKKCFHDCSEDDVECSEKEAFWNCDGQSGKFNTSQPDRSQCVRPEEKPKNCSQTDSRDTQWDCLAYKTCSKRCFSDTDCASDTVEDSRLECEDRMANWYCDGKSGRFSTPEPDRSQCVEEWVEDIVDNILDDSSNETSSQLADKILGELDKPDKPINGGGLRKLTTSLLDLVEKRKNETDDINGNFSLSFISSVDRLLASRISWQELSDDNERHESASLCLQSLTEAGRVHLLRPEQEGRSGGNMSEPPFDLEVVHITWEKCVGNVYEFVRDQESISVEFDDNCLSVISSAIRPDLISTNMFPLRVNDDKMHSIHNTIMELSFVLEEHQAEPDVSVTVVFDHDHKAAPPACSFWNPEKLIWSNEGCVLDKRESNFEQKLICRCDHLTSFGVLFGSPHVQHTSLTITTNVALAVSSLCLVATIVVLHFFHQTETLRHVVSLNRNYSLLLANLVFFGLLDVTVKFGKELCTTVSVFSHFLWLSVFSWTAMEGLVLYRKLVLVFDRGEDYIKLHCILGYCLPLLISLATFGSSLLVDIEYLADDVCWLNEPFLWAFRVPVALVCVFNLCIISRALTVILKFTSAQNARGASNRRWLSSFVLLAYLLGVGWLLGFLVQLHIVVEHVFVVVNGLLGVVVFVQGVLLNQALRDKARRSKVNSNVSSGKRIQFKRTIRSK